MAKALALAALCLWHLALRLSVLPLPMMSDEGEYAYQARVLSEGGAPYKDAFNQKPPLIFYLYRLAYGIFGQNDQAPRLLGIFFSWATIVLLFFLTPPGWQRLGAPALYAALSTLPVGDFSFPANTETFVAAFCALSALLLLKGRHGWAGLAMGLALASKQTALWTALAFAAFAAYPRPKRRPLLLFAAGCAGPLLALAALFWRLGALSFFWDQAYAGNMAYASIQPAGPQLSWLAKIVAPAFARGFWPCLALAAWGLRGLSAATAPPAAVLSTLWLGGALVGSATGLYFFPHYFLPVLPPLALCAALGLKKLKAKGWLIAVLALYPAAAYFRPYFLDTPQLLARRLLYPNPLYESKAAAEWIAARTAPGDPIYVFGSEPQIYVYAGRPAATRHIFVYPLTLFPRRAEDIQEELSQIAAAAPKVIVYVDIPASTLVASSLGESFQQGVLKLLGEQYRLSATIPPGLRLYEKCYNDVHEGSAAGGRHSLCGGPARRHPHR